MNSNRTSTSAGGGLAEASPDKVAVSLRGITKLFGDTVAVDDVSLDLYAGEVFSLLGPSGSGKTTTLNIIGGFEDPTKGEVFIHDRAMNGVASNRRDVNTVFQGYALFPHLNVRDNVAFGLRMKGVSRAERARLADEALSQVHLDGFGERRSDQLSGGQQQRVALARALVNRPRVLLLDEPLGALDLKLRRAMQRELKDLQEEVGITFLHVTHDQEEALALGHRVGVMHEGCLQQVGPPDEIYELPATPFVADFIGDASFFEGAVLDTDDARIEVQIGDAVVTAPCINRAGLKRGDPVTLMVRPEKIRLAPLGTPERVDGHAMDSNALEGRLESYEYHGRDSMYTIRRSDGGYVKARVPADSRNTTHEWESGAQVVARFPIQATVLLDNGRDRRPAPDDAA